VELDELGDSGFRIDLEQGDGRTLLRLTGKLGMEAGAAMRSAALQAAARGCPVDIDWQAAEYVGAGVIQSLVALGAAVSKSSAVLTVCRDRREIRDLLEVVGLARHFPVSTERGGA
jgi:anti-anti-sigma factor